MDRTMRIRLGVMILVLLVGAGSAFARPVTEEGAGAPTSPNPIERLWNWLAALFVPLSDGSAGSPTSPTDPGLDGRMSAEVEAGMGMDPNGGS